MGVAILSTRYSPVPRIDSAFSTFRRRVAAITPQSAWRAGFVTTACKNGVPDEMVDTRHRSVTTMRGCVRRGKLETSGPAGKLGFQRRPCRSPRSGPIEYSMRVVTANRPLLPPGRYPELR